MAIDRAAALRNAEKLLRQGKVEQAIAEYVRVVEDQPRDWNTANLLGDLYGRAGHPDKAVEQFTRIADHLSEQGFVQKASAIYKKILKIKPDNEHALLQSAEIAAGQGLLADARTALNAVAERRRSRGDKRGLAQIQIRIGTLDPTDYDARAGAAHARAEAGDAKAAMSDLKAIASELTDKGREAEAIEVLRAAAAIDPQDDEVRERLLAVYITVGDFERASQCATTVDQFKRLAAALEERGYPDHSLEALRHASRLDPADLPLKEQLARGFIARGDLTKAAEYLTAEIAGTDPELRLMMAEMRLRAGEVDEGIGVLRDLLAEEPSRREGIALLGWNIAEQAPDAGYRAVELAADSAVAQSDWPGAAAALQEFVTRVPNHIPALMRLVEICVDGALEATMYSAQAQLADAYIAAGAAAEARFIAEDLVAREPWERANVERFRRALVLLGEPDPDALIAERLSGQSPFTSTDFSIDDDLPGFEEPPRASGAQSPQSPAPKATDGVPELVGESKPRQPRRGGRDDADRFDLSTDAVDLNSILDEFDELDGKGHPQHGETSDEISDIDLSIEIEDFSADAATPGDIGEAQCRLGLALRDAGRTDEAITALQTAARTPRARFQAASALARMYRDGKLMPQAIEWFEQAVEAAAPSVDDSHEVLYELADALEVSGETARALAVCLELRADAGEYRDVSERIDRLAKVQTRG